VTLRILLAADFYPPFIGGSELQTQLLAEGLARRGHVVTVATVCHGGLGRSGVSEELRIHRLQGLSMHLPWAYRDPTRRRYHPPFPDPLIAFGLRQLVRRFHPDVLHATGWIAYSARLATMSTRVPLILSARDFGYGCPIRTLVKGGQLCSGPAYEKCLRHSAQSYGVTKAAIAVLGVLGLQRWLIEGTAAVHVASHFVADIERRDLTPLGQGQIALIPNMLRPAAPTGEVDGPDQAEQQDEQQGIPLTSDRLRLGGSNIGGGGEAPEVFDRLPREPFILFVGALQPHKGLGPLLAAYGRLSSPPPLVLVGTRWRDSPSEWPPAVTVLTDVPNDVVHRIWARSMFGVAPSIAPETFGGVVVEAMQHGRPVIASSIGGPLDTVLDGRTGFLVPPGDTDALVRAMQALVDDPGLRERMGSLARTLVRQRYQAGVVVPQFERLYHQVVGSRWGAR
jgi:glycosyltransferase involved in cell wall biosynthesis